MGQDTNEGSSLALRSNIKLLVASELVSNVGRVSNVAHLSACGHAQAGKVRRYIKPFVALELVSNVLGCGYSCFLRNVGALSVSQTGNLRRSLAAHASIGGIS